MSDWRCVPYQTGTRQAALRSTGIDGTRPGVGHAQVGDYETALFATLEA